MTHSRNTLYVRTDNTSLRKDGLNVVASIEKKEVARVPIHTVDSIICFGNIFITPPLMAFCVEQGVAISFLSTYGHFRARVEGPVSGNVLLRKAQYRASDNPEQCIQFSSMFLVGKFHNQRSVIRRALRDYGNTLDPIAKSTLKQFDASASAAMDSILAKEVQNIDSLRGLEGSVSRAYFMCLKYMILRDDFDFSERSRRPPLDPINCLLSFIYTLLVRDICGALDTFGLDCQAGFLHSDRPGRPSLALDILEEFRSCFADRLALSLLNRRQLMSKDFHILENKAVLLTDSARKQVLIEYQKKKQRELKHPFTGKKKKYGEMWFIQAQLLARSLRDDLDAYPPFLWK